MKTKILIVDDEKEFTDTLAERLELRDFAVSVSYSGIDALDKFHDTNPDVVLLDVLMPGKSGIEILKHIREYHPLVQVIMLTGKASIENAIEGMKLGAYDFLIKPAGADTLDEKIRKAAELKKNHEERIRQAEVDDIIERRGW